MVDVGKREARPGDRTFRGFYRNHGGRQVNAVEASPAGFGYIPVDLHANVRRSAAEIFLPEGVETWMHHPNRLLGNASPADLANTKAGYEKVMAILEGLKDGVFF